MLDCSIRVFDCSIREYRLFDDIAQKTLKQPRPSFQGYSSTPYLICAINAPHTFRKLDSDITDKAYEGYGFIE